MEIREGHRLVGDQLETAQSENGELKARLKAQLKKARAVQRQAC